MDFLWTKDAPLKAFPTLSGDRHTDVLVIGGGMAGVLCAMLLHRAGADCILAEANQIGHGMTRGTTAVLTAQHDTLYQDIIESCGAKKAKSYLDANLRAVEQFGRLSQEIPCDFEETPSVMYSRDDYDLMKNEVTALGSLGFSAQLSRDVPLPFRVAGAVTYPKMAQFHPLKFLYGAAEGLEIYENTLIEGLDGMTALSKKGRIHAKKIIVATHYPFINKHGLYFAKLHQRRSFVIALENAPKLGCTIEDIGENGVYLRNYKDLLLVGGGEMRPGKHERGFDIPRRFAARYFPDAREKYAWANQDCVSLDGLPYIGQYSPSMPNVYVASGFNLWGMTSSMVSANILTDMAMGKASAPPPVFQPSRSMLKPQLFANIAASTIGLLTPTVKRCPHMGCALKWNPVEKTWDCPCHGSRFDENGRLLNNPALKDAHVE